MEDGLIHITDLSWGRVSDPHEVVAPDQKNQCCYSDFDGRREIAHCPLFEVSSPGHPWDALSADLKVGDHVKGKVAYRWPTMVHSVK